MLRGRRYFRGLLSCSGRALARPDRIRPPRPCDAAQIVGLGEGVGDLCGLALGFGEGFALPVGDGEGEADGASVGMTVKVGIGESGDAGACRTSLWEFAAATADSKSAADSPKIATMRRQCVLIITLKGCPLADHFRRQRSARSRCHRRAGRRHRDLASCRSSSGFFRRHTRP